MQVKDLCKSLARCLKDPTQMHSLAPIVWESTTLSHGYPGLIIAFSLMEQAFPNEGWSAITKEYVCLLLDDIRQKGINNLSLFSGLGGIVSSLQYFPSLSFLSELEQLLAEKVEAITEQDVISGTCGILPALLRGKQFAAAKSILVRLVAADETGLDTGLAHGGAGTLFTLSYATMHGLVVAGQKELMEKIVTWLAKTYLAEKIWPPLINDEPFFYRDGWCYGSPGIALSLLYAAYALQCEKTKTLARESIEDVCLRWQTGKTNLDCVSFCHGYSGLLAIIEQFSKTCPAPLLKQTSQEIIEAICTQFNPNTPFGFTCKMTIPHEVCVNCPGLLNGSSGILITLLDTLLPKERTSAFAII